MSRGMDRYLLWGFLGAIAVHTGALAAGTRLSAIRPGNGSLEEIQVFDSRAPITVSPVALVEWDTAGADVAEPPTTTLITSQPSPPVATTREPQPRARTRPASPRRPPDPTPPPTVSTSTPRREPPDQASTASVPPAPSPRTPEPPPPGPDGGGHASGPADVGDGGAIDLGSPSANGDLPGIASGGTPVGDLPGTGAGTGAGSASGSGRGAGTGDGGGSGQGDGPGDGQSGVATGPPGGGFISRMADRQQPEVISKGTLTYPRAAVEDGVEGTVRLKVLVTENGEVASVEIERSSGDRRLDAAALEFVRGWRYRPAVQDGKPRRVYSIATVVFELR